MRLNEAIYLLVSPIFMIFAALACAGTALTDTPTFTCPTAIPKPTVTTLPGTPQPIAAPTVTPYVITPPDDFYVGDTVTVGEAGSPLQVHFRLLDVTSYPAPLEGGEPRRVYAWRLRVENAGSEDYEIFPAMQMILQEVTTPYGDVTGTWASTQAAADVAGLTIDSDIYTLTPGESRTFRLAAFGPDGTAKRFAFQLDPTVVDGSGQITWLNETNPYCEP